jgi:hypothetical protein
MLKFDGNLDINDNGVTNDFNEQLATLGVCEDKIYCSVLTDCNKLNMNQCAQILCTYYKNDLKLSAADATDRLEKAVTPGTCYADLDADQKENHWYTYAEPQLSCT